MQTVPTPPTCIDLFAGIGGMRLAFERAGAVCVFASEINRMACHTYAANFGDYPAGDITQIAADTIPDHDIMLAGFPCQPFSIAGITICQALERPHGFAHPRYGSSFFELVRILEHKRPRALLFENVPHLLHHDRGATFRFITQTLSTLGYQVFWDVIDARGVVPQQRKRVYIVGFRSDRATEVTFTFPSFPDRGPSVRAILEPDADIPARYTLSDRTWAFLQRYAAKHRARGNGFGYGLVQLDGITRTLTARYHKDGSEILIPQQGRNPRRLTPRECARLMGFPDTFRIVVSDTQAYRQFGNAVVVPIVEGIAHAMMRVLCGTETVANDTLPAKVINVE